MNRKYSGFTLVEMLIVMGIIIILMAVGITAGRFAINRANDVAHQDAADKLFVAVQAYMTDEREYPDADVLESDWETALGDDGALNSYLSSGEFEGGTDATYYYWTDTKSAMVCVSKGGIADEDGRGFYCTGNGINADGAPKVAGKDVDAGLTCPATGTWTLIQNWENTDGENTDDGGFTSEGAPTCQAQAEPEEPVQ